MRVIAGEARGRRLVAPRGLQVRPTADRLREALFSALGARVEESRWWDACAGSGAVGIEALSRGAASAVFGDPARGALEALRANLTATGLAARATVLALDWRAAARRLRAAGERFDFVYYDPPWAASESGEFLAVAAALLREGGWILIEHPSRERPAVGGSLELRRSLRAGGSTVSWYAAPGAQVKISRLPGWQEEAE